MTQPIHDQILLHPLRAATDSGTIRFHDLFRPYDSALPPTLLQEEGWEEYLEAVSTVYPPASGPATLLWFVLSLLHLFDLLVFLLPLFYLSFLCSSAWVIASTLHSSLPFLCCLCSALYSFFSLLLLFCYASCFLFVAAMYT